MIPRNVNIMALTATASDATIRHIVHDVGMHNPVLVEVCPDKQNLLFGVRKVEGFREAFTPLVMLLKSRRLNFVRTIIFCQRQVDCGDLYHLFEQELGEELTEPNRVHSSLPQYRLVNVYTKATEEEIKRCLLAQCTDASSCLRVIICTAAFGMGVDCIGVNRVVHYGPPNDVETYVQQTGRSGRNNEISYCQLLIAKDQMRFCDDNMKNFCENVAVCRRDSLYAGFSSYKSYGQKCGCCDICARKCKCTKCLKLLKELFQ